MRVHLRYLDLSYNLIECIKNLDDLNIKELNLEGNCITSFKSATPGRGINTLSKLRTIFLGYNRLSNLEFFKDAYSLRFIDLKFNKITDLLEVLKLKGSIFEVDFKGNTCTKWPNYRNVLIFSIPSVKFIDGVEVLATEKVKSAMLFASPVDLITARKVAKLTLLEHLNINKMDAHVEPYDEISPPLVILTGPSAMKKVALALHVARTISDKVKYCRWHTTKEMYEDDDERNAYILVSREEFNEMTRSGEFLVILDMLGHSYGFHTNQISPLISENKIGLTQMNLHAATEISKRYSNVRTILMYTQSVDLHRDWIREKFDVHTWIKDSMENLLVVKIKQSGKHREDEKKTASGILDFIKEILDEILCHFSTDSIYVRPQNGATTDIILKSKVMLPNAVVRKEIKGTKIKKVQTIEHVTKLFDQPGDKQWNRIKELKVILDEESNIIIDDEETKREIRKSKIFQRRSTLIMGTFTDLYDDDDDDLNETTSSNETTETDEEEMSQEEKAAELKNTYVELVIKSRNLYLDYHENHPGFFAFVLLMDDYTEAFNMLINFIHETCTSRSYRKSIFFSEMKHFRQTAISATLENIVNGIRKNLSILKF
ncbi:leucine-rich repeat and guanylate kinase domain-containing protein-like isoform X2 [Linepithema humile]|uniref:leucine-rich repeat and guanylate kinase domain-containing protein-like isoform X2 n=1 Tax=Linepithema humile TaxID=83485 RepID=UPI00351F4892